MTHDPDNEHGRPGEPVAAVLRFADACPDGTSARRIVHPHRPSTWLKDAEAQRLAELDALDLCGRLHAVRLAAPEGGPTRCDRCAVPLDLGERFGLYLNPALPTVILVAWLCPACDRLEGVNA